MYLSVKQKNGDTVEIIAARATERRLQFTCLRVPRRKYAGNFRGWYELIDVVSDPHVLNPLLEVVEEAVLEKEPVNSFSVIYPTTIGWSSTDRVDRYDAEDMETFKPNHRSTALRIKEDRRYIKAPATRELTIIYAVNFGREPLLVYINSIYPGPDIGELDGDLTAREGIVFFGWRHPGA